MSTHPSNTLIIPAEGYGFIRRLDDNSLRVIPIDRNFYATYTIPSADAALSLHPLTGDHALGPRDIPVIYDSRVCLLYSGDLYYCILHTSDPSSVPAT